MASCGISLNLSSLEGSITGHISTALGFAGLSGIPFMPLAIKVAMAASNGNLLGAIQIMVPSGAFDGMWSGLRDEIGLAMMDAPMQWSDGSFVDAASDGTGFFSSIKKTADEWGSGLSKFASTTGLDQLSGFVDINVTDLAKSAIGLGGSFDSCDFGTSGIQNFFRDPSTGTIKLLANYAPKLGDTSVAAGNNVLGLALELNTAFQSGKFKNALDLNVQIGNVISSGTNYALDSISGAVDIDPRDLNNIKQYLGGQTLPASLQRMTKSSTGVRQLTDKTNWTNKVHDKVINRFPRASGGVDNGLIVAIDFAI
jgi:hypothetical protein